eukprot:6076620-Lingulodinium_polyedra.AAC.1
MQHAPGRSSASRGERSAPPRRRHPAYHGPKHAAARQCWPSASRGTRSARLSWPPVAAAPGAAPARQARCPR